MAAAMLGGILPRPASASCPADPAVGPVSSRLSTVDASTRLSFIRGRMDHGAKRALAWTIGWGAAYGIAGATQLAVTPFVDEGVRIDLYVGAASAGIGVLTRAVLVPRVIKERRRLGRLVRDGSDPCEALHEAERGLVRSAKQERRGRHILMHLAALTYNAGIGLVLGLALDRPLSGNRQAVIGGTVGQIMFLTQPMSMVETLDAYRRGDPQGWLSAMSARPLVLRGGGGFAIGGSF